MKCIAFWPAIYETSCCSKGSLAFGFVFWILSPLIDVLLLFSCSVMSDSCDPHGQQHSRLPCPYLLEFAHSCPLNRWCHPTISSSVSWQILFSWAPKSLLMMTTAMILKDGCSLKESYDKSRQHIKKQRHHFANKGTYNQTYGFPSSHAWMWKMDHKECWRWRIDVF